MTINSKLKIKTYSVKRKPTTTKSISNLESSFKSDELTTTNAKQKYYKVGHLPQDWNQQKAARIMNLTDKAVASIRDAQSSR